MNLARYLKKQANYTEAHKKYKQAVHAYDKAIEFNPLHLGSWNNRGKALFEQGNYGMAIESYDRAIDINPQDPDVQNNRIEALNALASQRPNKLRLAG